MRSTPTLLEHQSHWFVREILHLMKRALKRLDLTARSFFAVIEPGIGFAGTLLELALAADRVYMLDDDDAVHVIALSPLNGGPLPMTNGLTRLRDALPRRARASCAGSGARRAARRRRGARRAGLVTFAPDEIDWDDDVRLAIEERAAFSPDALTGMEATLRFAGPETMETKIFGRLSAWQNWIFQRPNAIGENGALTLYGSRNGPNSIQRT